MSDALTEAYHAAMAAYEKQYGERDRQANKKLDELRELPAGFFTVNDLDFVLDPKKDSQRWTDEKVEWLNGIYERVKKKYL